MTHTGNHCMCYDVQPEVWRCMDRFAQHFKRRTIAATLLTIGFSCGLQAVTYQFPSGGGDLADLAKWQESYPSLVSLPGSTDTVKLGSSSVFTMSADMEVNKFSFNYQNATLDLASSGNHTLKVLDSNDAFGAYDGAVKGGVIDRNGQNFYWFQTSDNEMTVSDGCILTNANVFYVNVWGKSGGKLHLSGASRIYAKGLTLNSGIANTTSGSSLLNVTGGSKVYIAGNDKWSYSDTTSKEIASGGNVLSVSGYGSEVSIAGNYINGYFCNGNSLCVADEGVFSSKTLYVGHSGGPSHSNRLVVVGGNLNVTGGNLCCYGYGNIIAVTNGAVDIGNKVYSYDGSSSTDAKIDIVNSSWKCAVFNVGKSVDLHISGASTVFQSSNKFFGLNNPSSIGSKITLSDGFAWSPDIGYGYYFMQNSTNCALTVQDNATFSAWNPSNNECDRIILCGSSGANNGVGNIIRVLSGGTIRGETIELNGQDNFVAVSNGVFNASNSIQLGAVDGTSNNTVVVQGNVPRLSAGGIFYLRYHTTLRIEIPESGYASGCVPITASQFSLHKDTCRFEIDVSRFQPKDKSELTLISFGSDLTSEHQEYLLSAELPPRYSLEISGNRSLVLKAKGEPKGFMMTVR